MYANAIRFVVLLVIVKYYQIPVEINSQIKYSIFQPSTVKYLQVLIRNP